MSSEPTVRIVTDSACDLSVEETTTNRIGVVPLTIRFGNDEYIDIEEISPQSFYEKMAATDILPATAAPSAGKFEQEFRRMAAEGATAVVCINLSLELSATGQAAQQAADSIGDDIDVRVVDSTTITAGLGTIVLRAAEAAASGATADEVVALVEQLRTRTRVFGALDTLENLKKGGRIGGAKALLGSVLNIKPILNLSSGAVSEAGKERTRKKALKWLCNELTSHDSVSDVTVIHGDADDVDDFHAQVSALFPDREIRINLVGPVIGAHAGPRLMAIAFTVDS
jgi:DegV family protein with EDD domain